MYEILKYGLPVKILKTIKNSYDGFKCRVKTEGVVVDTFEVRSGVRQGDVWSLFLFRIVRGGKDIYQSVADLDFAEEVTLVGNYDPYIETKYNGAICANFESSSGRCSVFHDLSIIIQSSCAMPL